MNTKQEAFVGTLAVSAVATAVALSGGTAASFQDVEKHADNSIKAGTLDLEDSITDSEGNAVDRPITVTDWKPGQAPTCTVTLKNVGSVDGSAILDVVEESDADNGLVEPETAAGDDASWGAAARVESSPEPASLARDPGRDGTPRRSS